MELGELFLIEDLHMDLEQRVLWAAERYQRKYGQQPTLCLLHPSLLDGKRRRVGGLRLMAKKSVLPNYLWLGAPAESAVSPWAR
jgi:hypothetical protein